MYLENFSSSVGISQLSQKAVFMGILEELKVERVLLCCCSECNIRPGYLHSNQQH